MTESKIKSIEFPEKYKVKISLENDHCIIYNMKPKLNTARFHDLYDFNLFSQGQLKGHMIHWSPNMELSLDEILEQIINDFLIYK